MIRGFSSGADHETYGFGLKKALKNRNWIPPQTANWSVRSKHLQRKLSRNQRREVNGKWRRWATRRTKEFLASAWNMLKASDCYNCCPNCILPIRNNWLYRPSKLIMKKQDWKTLNYSGIINRWTGCIRRGCWKYSFKLLAVSYKPAEDTGYTY